MCKIATASFLYSMFDLVKSRHILRAYTLLQPSPFFWSKFRIIMRKVTYLDTKVKGKRYIYCDFHLH